MYAPPAKMHDWMEMENIVDITGFIRDYGHEARHLQTLISDLVNWNQIWSAADVIDDNELAIAAYEQAEFDPGSGEAYLFVYGILQVLFVQQDAVLHLCEALHPLMKIELTDRLKEIRELRTFSIGHPTKVKRHKQLLSTRISRGSLNKNGFDLFSFSLQDRPQINHVDIRALIRDQRQEVLTMLKPLVQELKARDEQHKAQFRGQKLVDDFNQVLYAIEKIYETLRKEPSGIMGAWGVEHLQTSLKKFEESLRARGMSIETYDVVKYTYQEISHPLAQLKLFLDGDASEIASTASALVFVGFLAERFTQLNKLASEIDADYGSPAIQQSEADD
jgi:hypothetical protein